MLRYENALPDCFTRMIGACHIEAARGANRLKPPDSQGRRSRLLAPREQLSRTQETTPRRLQRCETATR